MKKMNVNGISLAYQAEGSGSPLVLLHGGLSDSRAWNREINEFSDEFRVIAWDAPGCGKSSDPPEGFSLEDYADTLSGFIRKLDFQQAHFLGLSFGGGLAIQLFRRSPDIVRSMILVSAYAGWAGSLPPEEVDRRWRLATEFAEKPGKEVADLFIPTLFPESTPGEIVEETAAIIADFHPSGMLTMLHAFAKADLSDVLPEITIPVLLLYGDKDKRSSLEVARKLHTGIPSSELVIFPGVGHMVNKEAPDRFDAEVREFVGRQAVPADPGDR